MEEEKDLIGYSLKSVAEEYYKFLMQNDRFPSEVFDSGDRLYYAPLFKLKSLGIKTTYGAALLEDIVIVLSQTSAGIRCIYRGFPVEIDIDYMKLLSRTDSDEVPMNLNEGGVLLLNNLMADFEETISLVETCVDETMKASMRTCYGDAMIAA